MHIFNFVKTFLLPRGYEIHLLTLSTQPIRDEFRIFYRENGVVVHSVYEKGYKSLNRKDKLFRLLNLWRKLRLMRDVPHVDVCHVQSVYKTALLMVSQNKRKFNHLILSYWGGDVEDRSQNVIRLRETCFPRADVITVTVQQTMNQFHEIHGHAYDDKLCISRFSTAGLDCIYDLSKVTTRCECRKSYSIPDDKVCITCGYSAYAEQHQERCLSEMMKLPPEMRRRLFVIVPMQYGRYDEAYIHRVEEEKNKCDFDCVILDQFMPFEMSAKLAIGTDIYLHLRDTDAFSNALKEHVYSGSVVVTGTWLKYIELEQMKAQMIDISDFNELAPTLEKLIESIHVADEFNLFEPIYEMYSTESVKVQWQAVVDKATNNSR